MPENGWFRKKSIRGGALPSSVFARLASGSFCETIVLVTFCRILKITRAAFPLDANFILK